MSAAAKASKNGQVVARKWVSVRISEGMWRAARLEAIRRGVELGEFLSFLVQVALEGVAKGKGVRR